MPRKISILISYVAAGTGHRRAAEAIAEAARRRLPDAEIRCVDLLAYSPGWLRWVYPRIYAWLVRYLPSFWAAAYYALDHPFVFGAWQPWRRRWNRLMARRFVQWVQSEPCDVVIATHFFPADVIAAAQQTGELCCRLIIVITDLFPHRLWLAPGAREVEIVVGSLQTQRICQQRGIAEDRLHVLGIPIGPGFCRRERRAVASRMLGLDPSRRTILMVSGGMGYGPLRDLTKQFMALETTRPRALQLLVVCGQNQRLMRQLTNATKGSAMPVRLFGFVQTMPELMQASDLVVTKPGGLTVMEALAMGLPMVFCGMIPGQERFNADVVVQHGAGVMAKRVEDVITMVLDLLDDPERLQVMQAHALALSKPQAAVELVERLVIQSIVDSP